MHAVLCVEEMCVGREVRLQTDEQTLLGGKPSSFLRENSGRQLLGISDKNTLGAAVLERNQCTHLNTLGSLIHNDSLELNAESLEHLVT